MHLLALPFGAWSFTLIAAAVAVVVGLYILKLRRRPVAVPFAPLWTRILRDKEATSLFSRLRRLLSLLLQLVLLGLLILALSDPRTAVEVVHGRTVVVLADTSASMKARDGGTGPSRLDAARESLRTLVRGLGASDRMLLAAMDAQITPLSPMTGDVATLETALEKLCDPASRPGRGCVASDTAVDFPRALRFALDSLRGSAPAEIVLLSDGQLGDAKDALGAVHLGDVKLSFVPIGQGARNVAITQFSVRRYPLDKSRYEVMLEVRNLGTRDEDVELQLLGDDVLVHMEKLSLKAGAKLPTFYPNLGGAARTLEARLTLAGGASDDLDADNHAYAVLPERRRAKILAVTSGNTYLEAALLLDEYLDVTTVNADHMATALQTGTYDVAIFDGVAPPLKPGLPALYLDTRPGGPVRVDPKPLKEPSFDTLLRKHPILRWTALENVGIAASAKLLPGEGDRVVGASNEGAILVAGARSGTKFVALGFDVRQSDFPLRIAWPVFLLNCINWFVEEDAEYFSSFRTGEVWHVPAPVGAANEALLLEPEALAALKRGVRLEYVKEGKHRVPVVDGRAVTLGTHAGFHKLRLAEGSSGAPREVLFAANLVDATESSIAPRTELVVDEKKAGSVEGFRVGVRRELWVYLLIAVVALSALEWASYHRRVTV